MAKPKKGQTLPDQNDGRRPVEAGPDAPPKRKADPPPDARPPVPGDDQAPTSLATCPYPEETPAHSYLEEATKFNARGRPPVEVSEREVELLASVGASKALIARRLGMAKNTLYNRFLDAFNRGAAVQEIDLHIKQCKSALEDGNVRMLIHLGINVLGQRTGYQANREEDPDQPGAHEGLERGDLTRDELMQIARAGLKELKRKGRHGGNLDAGGGGGGDLIDGSGHGKPDRLH